MAEWLRRWTANPLCSARVGSNPILVGLWFPRLAPAWASQVVAVIFKKKKIVSCNAGDRFHQEDPLEEFVATHTGILAWRMQLVPLDEGMATYPSILAWRRQLFLPASCYVLPEIVCIETRIYIYICGC